MNIMSMMSTLRWTVKDNEQEADSHCIICGKACVTKNIGDVCVACLDSVPDHIPNAQLVKYLRAKHECP